MEKPKKLSQKVCQESVLLDLFDRSILEIQGKRYSKSFELLKKCEKNLESLISQGHNIDSDLILATLHNLALCSQSLNLLLDCSSYLEACIYNIKSKPSKSQKSLKKSETIRKTRYLCLLYLQHSDTCHKLQNHSTSLSSAQKSLKASFESIKLCLNYCNDQKLKKNLKQSNPLLTNKRSTLESFSEAHQVLHWLYLQMNGKKIKKNSEDLQFKGFLSGKKETSWVADLNFEQIFEVKVLLIEELKAGHNIKVELSKDFMFDKICMAISAFYLVFRELSKLSQEPLKAKAYLKRSLIIAKTFLPGTSPLLNGLVKEYNKHFVKNSQRKTSLRSRSAKDVRSGQSKTLKNPIKKNHVGMKVLPWVIRSERLLNSTSKKKENTQSEETLQGKAHVSLGRFEKTEPEPPLSEESSDASVDNIVNNFALLSNELYGEYVYEEPDKYEYMPLKRL
jgi:hypothetical protein